MNPLWLPIAVLVTALRLAFLLALEIPVAVVAGARHLLQGNEVAK